MSSTSATAMCLSNSCCLFLVLRLLRGRRDDRGQRRRGEGLHGRGDQGQPSSVLLAPLRMDFVRAEASKDHAEAADDVENDLAHGRRGLALSQCNPGIAKRHGSICLAAGRMRGADGCSAEPARNSVQDALRERPQLASQPRAVLPLGICSQREEEGGKQHAWRHAALEHRVSVARIAGDAGEDAADVEHGADAQDVAGNGVTGSQEAPCIHARAGGVANGRAHLVHRDAIQQTGDGGVQPGDTQDLPKIWPLVQGHLWLRHHRLGVRHPPLLPPGADACERGAVDGREDAQQGAAIRRHSDKGVLVDASKA
mmetsp:Transcript_15541/g.42945  ORF Transcript_15541/g.42945 Transcript_15541/m.42945 type:complete len:312 (+) Transcript_15541:150-1085(+)|eukprot:CAMPEP_0177406210 /NCGR_PEP_ID=MMETSP0368-20130122/62439_1 /TAXON_ID=447022 ORGANISM="Scrippsiella hangoei-like, Strain SHHI-4" /NCGR_SAMPLE_ID=MMETSP0368 /ASSEMBLY_ACC=CAM_ASM_000363 /LENGTH=311 /DNA_ID=CAMNT_0018874597 /DNA_START=122 /DNA_END=1053 /DNA_ORIENTATION=-